MAITVREFSNSFRGSMLPDPLDLFLFLNLLQIYSAEKNYAWKNIEIWCPFLKKFLITL